MYADVGEPCARQGYASPAGVLGNEVLMNDPEGNEFCVA